MSSSTSSSVSNGEDHYDSLPEFGLDFLTLSDPLKPKLDLDIDTRTMEKKNRHAMQLDLRSTSSSSSDDESVATVDHPISPSESVRDFLESKLPARFLRPWNSRPTTPTTTPLHLKLPTTLPHHRYNLSQPTSPGSPTKIIPPPRRRSSLHPTTGSTLTKSHSENPAVARAQCTDAITQRHLVGFHLRKTGYALASNDFDTMLFQRDGTLKLSLTPNLAN